MSLLVVRGRLKPMIKTALFPKDTKIYASFVSKFPVVIRVKGYGYYIGPDPEGGHIVEIYDNDWAEWGQVSSEDIHKANW